MRLFGLAITAGTQIVALSPDSRMINSSDDMLADPLKDRGDSDIFSKSQKEAEYTIERILAGISSQDFFALPMLIKIGILRASFSHRKICSLILPEIRCSRRPSGGSYQFDKWSALEGLSKCRARAP